MTIHWAEIEHGVSCDEVAVVCARVRATARHRPVVEVGRRGGCVGVRRSMRLFAVFSGLVTALTAAGDSHTSGSSLVTCNMMHDTDFW